MAKNDTPRVGAGDMTFILDDSEYVMVPSLRAARTICRRYQNLVNAATQAAMGDIECILVIVQAGCGLTPHGLAALEEKIFAAGISDDSGGFAKLCAEYCNVLSNGGRPLSQSNRAEASNDTQDPPNSRRATRSTSTG